MKKITALTWIISGLCLGLSALAFGYFYFYKPNMTEKERFDEQKTQLEAVIADRPRAQKRVEEVAKKVVAANSEWQAVVDEKTPAVGLRNGGIDLSVNAWQLVVDAPKFRDSIQLAVNRQVKRGGVTVVTGPLVPQFSENATDILATNFNYPALSFPIAMYDLGTVTVKGTFEQIMDNFESWSEMPNYLAVPDALAFTGTSPNLTGTYVVTLVAYIQADTIGSPVPEGGAPSASGGGGAALGGGFGPGGPAGGRGGPGSDPNAAVRGK